MEIQDYLQKNKDIHKNLIDFIENESNIEENYQNIISKLNDLKIKDNKQELRTLIHLISSISNNHNRSTGLINKVERLIKLFSDEMKNFFSNKEIFHFFKHNKRILLFLFSEKILQPDEYIYKIISDEKYKERFYLEYFFNEFKSFLNEQKVNEITTKNSEIGSESYEEKRKKGENDSEICNLVQNDSIENFIIYVNKHCVSIKSYTIESSIYETNHYLLKRKPSLIEYSAFYGSVQIFRYLFLNQANVTPLVWFYTVHGQNPELFDFLEEKYKIQINYNSLIEEAIKCHHNEITNYIQNNFLHNNDGVYVSIFYLILKCYNFLYFPVMSYNEVCFYNMCKFDYVSLVTILLKQTDIDVNRIIISIIFFFFLI